MLHIMLRYPEEYMDLIFVSICTIPLELRVEKNVNLYAETNDDEFFVNCVVDQFCSNKEDLPSLRRNSSN